MVLSTRTPPSNLKCWILQVASRKMIGDWNNGTGRRKSSVARVFIKKGSGQIKVNGKDIAEYFGRATSIMIVQAAPDVD